MSKILYRIFIFGSIAYLLGMICFYGYRMYHYYKLEHTTLKTDVLSDRVGSEVNVSIRGEGLKYNGGVYLFKGNNVNNYVYYSGRLWRIMQINKDRTIRMIVEESQTSLVWGYDSNNYDTSYIRSWLNVVDGVSGSGTFYHSLDRPDEFLVPTTWCIGEVKEEGKNNCNVTNTVDKVGLLSMEEYLNVGGKDSYLYQNKYEWLINPSTNNKVWYLFPGGGINDESYSNTSYHAYGIRPIITLKADTKISGGSGSLEYPYTITPPSSNQLKDKLIGEYISLDNYLWRIIDKTSAGIKVAMAIPMQGGGTDRKIRYSNESNVFNPNEWGSLAYEINHSFYNWFPHKEYLVPGIFQVGEYSVANAYHYLNLNSNSVKANFGLMKVGDFFLGDVSNYALLNHLGEYSDEVYTMHEDGRLYPEPITKELNARITMTLKDNLVITKGTGMKNDPYEIGEVSA